jgi:transcriptional regulator with XRE-family HTH domain
MSIANNSLNYNGIEVIPMYERIRNLREDKDMTQTQVASYLNCSQRIYSNYERGEVDIPTGILIKLADLHKTSTDYLLNRTNVKKAYPKD